MSDLHELTEALARADRVRASAIFGVLNRDEQAAYDVIVEAARQMLAHLRVRVGAEGQA